MGPGCVGLRPGRVCPRLKTINPTVAGGGLTCTVLMTGEGEFMTLSDGWRQKSPGALADLEFMYRYFYKVC